MHCPNCGTEYGRRKTICPDCNVALVPDQSSDAVQEALGPDRFDPDDYDSLEPVCAYSTPSHMRAEVVLSVFRSNDVRAFVAGPGMEGYTGSGGLGDPLSLYRIMVHPDDVEDARQILEEKEQAIDQEDPEAAYGGEAADAPNDLETEITDVDNQGSEASDSHEAVARERVFGRLRLVAWLVIVVIVISLIATTVDFF